MCRPHIFVDLGQEIGPYSHYRAPRCVEGTHHPDPCGKRGREQDALLGNHSKGSVNAELHRSGLVIVAARFQGKARFSYKSASFEALRESLDS